MIVTSKQEAWKKVNEIFPTDYEQDITCTIQAGYPIYRSTVEGHYYDYICDLGNSLEVNLDSSGQPTIRINIVESDQELSTNFNENNKASVDARHAAEALGQSLYPLFELEQYIRIALVIDGDHRYIANDTNMYKVYEGLKRGESWLAGDLIASYCESHGIRWATITDTKICYYNHGNKGENYGHFVIEGYILPIKMADYDD